MSIEFSHVPVLLNECIEGLNIDPAGIYVDCTAGGGGHSSEIAKRLTTGKLISLDQDQDAIDVCRQRLSVFGERSVIVKSNFSMLDEVLKDLGIDRIDGVLMDLGISSYQIDEGERGFSLRYDAELDMRMDRSMPLSAYQVVNEYPQERIKEILYEYGEEKFAPQIARRIVERRTTAPIRTTFELADVVRSAMPEKAIRKEAQHPAKRTFQAIRIEVNHELDVITPAIKAAEAHLKPGGRIAIITFHSLEDRIVKNAFAELAKGCTCPPDFPVCVCGNKPRVRLVSRKPILPGKEELERNSRAASAKLRVCEKC